ncbi:flavin-containing monooxygenase [Nocardia sp. CA-120079]|uniref:flavin-containing monooxygenase n=1 Tax=Nocardia sp. CA-120079 TaxID=3239974 RepID=UPI003D978353
MITHLSGDPAVIGNPRDWEELLDLADEILPAFLTGEKVAGYPSDKLLRACADLVAGESVPEELLPMTRQQMRLGPPEDVEPLPIPEGFSFAVIGGGLTGILAGVLLERSGVADYTIFERGASVGGTWRDNVYPGCRVDTPSVFYSYSFAPDQGWPDHFSFQPAVLQYLESFADGIAEHIRLNTEVRGLRWLEADKVWEIVVVGPDGRQEISRANVVLGATGILHWPKRAELPGLDRFEGVTMHSATWRSDVDLRGKRVAVVGAGASANQIVPAIAGTCEHVTVFQRSPHWIMSHPRYGKSLVGAERWLIEKLPFYLNWLRFKESWLLGDHILESLRVDPDWPRRDSVNAKNDEMRRRMVEYASEQLKGRPDLLEKVLPDFPPHAKRILVDNGWYQALLRSDTTLVTDPIQEVTETGVVTADGFVPLDVIVLATGFDTSRVLWPIEIRGRNDVDVRARLDEQPEAYMGIAMADCPNLFNTFGPHGITAHGSNGAVTAEMQLGFALSCVRHMLEEGSRSIEIRDSAVKQFVAESRESLRNLVWSAPGVSTWFKAGSSEPTAILPWRAVDVWHVAQSPDFSLFVTDQGEPGCAEDDADALVSDSIAG